MLLARLLVPAGAKPPSLAALRKDVTAAAGPLTDDGWSAAVAALADAGLATLPGPPARPAGRGKPVAMHLTDAGRSAAVDHHGWLLGRAKLTAARIAKHWAGRPSPPPVGDVALTLLYLKPTAAKPLRTAAAKIAGPVDDAAWSAAVSALVSAGLVNDPAPPPPAAKGAAPAKQPPIELTDAGRSAAHGWLGDVPGGARWPQVVAGHLFPATRPPGQRSAARDGNRLAGLLVGEALDVGPAETVTEAVAAAVCRDLGFPDLRSMEALTTAVIGRRLGKPLPAGMTVTDRNRLVTQVVLGTPKDTADVLRAAAVRQWATGGPPAADANPGGGDQSLAAFAAAVRRAAAATPTGRWGDKVFISHVHRHMPGHPSLEAFKRRLVEANTEGLVRLHQADLMAALDPADVRASETAYLSAVFHFVSSEPGGKP